MISVTPAAVTDFWVGDCTTADWYRSDPSFDAQIRDRFATAWNLLRQGGLEHWRCSAEGALAYIVLADQFSRNMFRGEAKAFATDRLARAATKQAIDHRWDWMVPEPQRQFVYMPLVHSECSEDQDRGVRLMQTRMPETGAENLLHARAHRDVIRQFGRFPFRNEALGRATTAQEQRFLDEGGYGAVVKRLRG